MKRLFVLAAAAALVVITPAHAFKVENGPYFVLHATCIGGDCLIDPRDYGWEARVPVKEAVWQSMVACAREGEQFMLDRYRRFGSLVSVGCQKLCVNTCDRSPPATERLSR
jgi:hypothetical protein